MSLLAIAYPELSNEDYQMIESYRIKNDKLFSVVRPHFTFVFAISDFSIVDFSNEIRKQLYEISSIQFCLRNSIVKKDELSDNYMAYLVPDKGLNQMVNLHDRLYSDKLYRHLRSDIDFIPHITIGSLSDREICNSIVNEWNEKNIEINGIIDAVDIIKFENDCVTSLERIELKN